MTKDPAKPRVFIVEDEGIIACALQLQLETLGYAVLGVAADGADALSRIAADPPELLVTDIRIKGDMDGVTLAAECRELHGCEVVFLTGHADDETVARAAKARPSAFLVKPYAERELRAAVEIALYRRRVEAELQGYRSRLEELVRERTRELEAALAQVKRLTGIIPVCMYCRRVRDERERWQKMEEYIEAHSEADFSHGLCPECYRETIRGYRARRGGGAGDRPGRPSAPDGPAP